MGLNLQGNRPSLSSQQPRASCLHMPHMHWMCTSVMHLEFLLSDCVVWVLLTHLAPCSVSWMLICHRVYVKEEPDCGVGFDNGPTATSALCHMEPDPGCLWIERLENKWVTTGSQGGRRMNEKKDKVESCTHLWEWRCSQCLWLFHWNTLEFWAHIKPHHHNYLRISTSSSCCVSYTSSLEVLLRRRLCCCAWFYFKTWRQSKQTKMNFCTKKSMERKIRLQEDKSWENPPLLLIKTKWLTVKSFKMMKQQLDSVLIP